MKTLREYYEAALGLAEGTPGDVYFIEEARTRVLSEPAPAKIAVPPFDCAVADGFALCRMCALYAAGMDHINSPTDVTLTLDKPVTLPVVADIPVGCTDVPAFARGHAFRVMSGAPLPEQVDVVIDHAHIDSVTPSEEGALPKDITITSLPPRGRNMRTKGENIAEGEVVFEAGHHLGPAALATLVSVGYDRVTVHRQPRVGVLVTGPQLRSPGEDLAPGQIPDSNTLMIEQLLQGAGAHTLRMGSAGDDAKAMSSMADWALDQGLDLLVTSGGTAAGLFDIAKIALEPRGVEFMDVSIQPGGHQGLGLIDGKLPCLALPGSPEAAFVSMILFVLPLVRKLNGDPPRGLEESLTIGSAGQAWTKSTDAAQLIPCAPREDGMYYPFASGGMGTHLISTFHAATHVAYLPRDLERVEVGDALQLFPLQIHEAL
ncbi:MAG: molybdopterin molybdotransferase MoeA [Actinomycetaceae bacterium]|nr:molybdopterin molybdotransferase MoeA [Actinomycetaceae bacterium]